MQRFPMEHSAAIDTTPDVNSLKQFFYVPTVFNYAFFPQNEQRACVSYHSDNKPPLFF